MFIQGKHSVKSPSPKGIMFCVMSGQDHTSSNDLDSRTRLMSRHSVLLETFTPQAAEGQENPHEDEPTGL